MIRMEKDVNGVRDYGEWEPNANIKGLGVRVEWLNSKYGAGTHWIGKKVVRGEAARLAMIERNEKIAAMSKGGMTYPEIGEKMDMTVSAVSMAITRYRKRLNLRVRYVKGHILPADIPEFSAMVEKARKGESDERDGDDNQ